MTGARGMLPTLLPASLLALSCARQPPMPTPAPPATVVAATPAPPVSDSPAPPPVQSLPEPSCTLRGVERPPYCTKGQTPTAGDRITAFGLNGPDTGGDQMRTDVVCFGLILETTRASGLECSQRIGSFREVGIMGGGPVYVDDEEVCLRTANGTLTVERKGVPIVTMRAEPGMETATAFPERCK